MGDIVNNLCIGKPSAWRGSSAPGAFTAIELLIVASLTLFLAAMAIPIYGGLSRGAYLNERTAEIVQTLRLAQQRSMARVNDLPHGVYFDINPVGADKFVLYQGASFVGDPGRDTSYDRTIVLENSLEMVTTLLDGEINFSQGLGEPSIAETAYVVLTNAAGQSRAIAINTYGMVDSD